MPGKPRVSRESADSIYKIAERAGVSASTVSRVLNQRGGIGSATRKSILEHARAVGFKPRMKARQRTIAVVTDRTRFSNSGGFVTCLLSSLVQALSKEDVAVELVTEHNRGRLSERLIDGVLAMVWDEETLDRLRSMKDVPVVTINSVNTPECSAVVTDHHRQAEMAVEYFVRNNHKRIVMICEESENWGSRQRVEGFRAGMAAAGLPVDEQSIAFTGHQPIYGLLHRMMSGVRPTAIFVADENLGLEASYILRHVLGLSIPQDVSLIGMESVQVSQFLSPPLTTIGQPLDELAARSLEVLLQHVAGDREPRSVVLPCRLIERESVAMLQE